MMSDGPVFSAEDRLRLIQLWTRRAMAERNAARVDQAPESDTETKEGAQAPIKWRLVPVALRLHDWQAECLAKWLPLARGTVKVATGGGKTLFALAAAQALQNHRDQELRLVVVVPTIPLMHQWMDEVAGSNIPLARIGLMGGGHAVPRAKDVSILIAVINSARERLFQFVAHGGWAGHMLLVVDECHRASAEQGRRIFDSKPAYTLGLSATPEQEGEDESLPNDEAYAQSPVGQALGPIIYDFTLRQSLAAGLLTPFEVLHIGLPLNADEGARHGRLSREISELRKQLQPLHERSRSRQSFIAWCQTQASRGGLQADLAARLISLSSRRKDLLFRAESRSAVALGILKDAAEDPDSRAIVFHERIAEIESLYLSAEKDELPAVLEHSELPESLRAEAIDAFRQGAARIIISAKSLVEGFNVPSADIGVIAASSSSVRQRIQSLGRMLRRKEGSRTARIYVLYVADTEDEAIYERTDWDRVIGASRSSYFRWQPRGEGGWAAGLMPQAGPPRTYRPPSTQISIDELEVGKPYPGQTQGIDLKVDQAGNLRTSEGALVDAPPDTIAVIRAANPFRRARVTPAGHLIARADSGSDARGAWHYLGLLPLTVAADSIVPAETFVLQRISGRARIARKMEESRGALRFALGIEEGASDGAGAARDTLLSWITAIERDLGAKATKLYWDGRGKYWLELRGERITHPGPLSGLEFAP